MKAVLSRRVAEERIVVVEKLDLESHKTKDLKAALGTLGIEGKALFVDGRGNENFTLASRNVKAWKLVDPLGVNAYDVLSHGDRRALEDRVLARRQEPGRRVMLAQELIRRPLITEKATRLKEASNTVCFEVAVTANKIEVAKAITKLFGVKVVDVRLANRQGKWKRMGRFIGQRKAWKKAYVRLAPDQKIEFFEGV